MAVYNILSIGSHPNIAFYNWRLHSSGTANISTVISTAISNDPGAETIIASQPKTYSWSSNQFGNDRFILNNTYTKLEDFISYHISSSDVIDFIFLSATSLQELSTVCSNLNPLIKNQLKFHNVPSIIIESTNFVNLEPFVKMSLQLDEIIPIFSIMSDFDIREIGNSNYLIYKSKKESELLYVGKSGKENTYTSQEIGLINKIADIFENSNIDVYKLNTPLEFLSYQWKFALPKITVEPLSIIFEKPFPNDLQQQILAKPLISGLIFEIITVIKTMGCKLFNSYDNEDALLERLSQLYPSVKLSIDAAEAPKLYYDFLNQNELYLDLLLLQPILIADDYHVKTPYLEFLYAVMSQYNTNNFSTLNNSTSIFWLRKNSENIRQLKLEQDQIALQNNLREKEIQKAEIQLQHKTPPRTKLTQSQQSQIHQQQQQQQQQQQYNQNYGDSPIDPEMEEISEMVNSYGITDGTPQSFNNEFVPNKTVHPTSNLQAGFHQNGNIPSPQFMPQQNLPHGLPPQGLPPNQPIFNHQQQQQQYPQQYPPQSQQQRRSYMPNGLQQQQQQQQQPPPPRSNGYMQFSPQQQQPMNMYSSRDDVSYMSGRGGYTNNNNFDTSFNSMSSVNGPPQMNMGKNMGPVGPNRPFKPTSRKSSRKSTAALTNSLVGLNDQSTRGIPNRKSMVPMSMNQQSNIPTNQQLAASQSMTHIPLSGSNMGSNSNLRMMGGSTTNLRKQNSQFGLDSAFTPPNSNGIFSESNNGSNSSLLQQKPELVPVPEATPSPTPAYTPPPKSEETKKKKRGFMGLGKKKK